VPLVDRGRRVDGRARLWCGDWGAGWRLLEIERGLAVRFGALPAVGLVPYVRPSYRYEEGELIDLVVDGLEMMVRLGWKVGKRMVEVWQNNEVIVLERKA